MKNYTEKELKELKNDDLVAIIDTLSDEHDKDYETTGNKADLVARILSILSGGEIKPSNGIACEQYLVLKTFDTVFEGKRISGTQGQRSSFPEGLVDDLIAEECIVSTK